MSKQLEKRIHTLELVKNPPMGIEDFLEWSKDENREPILYAPGENRIWDFICSLREELTRIEGQRTA